MFKMLIGFIIGVALTLTIIYPENAKHVASNAVDGIHSSYVTGSKFVNDPAAIKDTMSTVKKAIDPN